jgi:hypothetical protein
MDISRLLDDPKPEEPLPSTASLWIEHDSSASASSVSAVAASPHGPEASATGVKRGQPTHPSETPAKKNVKWTEDQDAVLVELRGDGMTWDDISKRLPGRTALSCRLHYQNYLERRVQWDEKRKDKLAHLYQRSAKPSFTCTFFLLVWRILLTKRLRPKNIITS